jgi:hypothetical protein
MPQVKTKPTARTRKRTVIQVLPDHQTIERLAYDHWLRRGSPQGTAQEDWRWAEDEVERTIFDLIAKP